VVKRVGLAIIGALALMSISTTVAFAWTPEDAYTRGQYPHTGTQIAFMAIAVFVLLVGGILLWYFSHPRKRKGQGPSDEGSDDRS
jgi:hypothetical protein